MIKKEIGMEVLNSTNSLLEYVLSAELNALEPEAYERAVVEYLNSIDEANRADHQNLRLYSKKLERIQSK